MFKSSTVKEASEFIEARGMISLLEATHTLCFDGVEEGDRDIISFQQENLLECFVLGRCLC